MNEETQTPQRMDRRAAIRWILAASATIPFLDTGAFAQSGPSIPNPKGYGSDPNLISPEEVPWKRTLSESQLQTASALSDVILPRVGDSPSASELNITDFIDEWVSAPYDSQKADRKIVLDGLKWINAESRKRFKKRFHELDATQQTAICDDICYVPRAKSEHKKGARFFAKYRNLTMGGYYTTTAGAREVGYVGNVALAQFDGPPPEVLDHLGIDEVPW